MVMGPICRALDQVYWRTMLEAFYTALQQRDVSGYAWADSDGWTQSRTPTEWSRHLECWIDLGGTITLAPPNYQHEGRLVFAARYHADDDSTSQARLQAAIRDACELLLRLQLPDGARVLGLSQVLVEGPYQGGFVEVSIGFTALFPR